tara:strand:- start:8759 stop:8944 length:186 start_codon:yes stop_codon:yes gene_type:complete
MLKKMNDERAMVADEGNEMSGAFILFDGDGLLVGDVQKLEGRGFRAKGNHCRGCGNHGDFI